MSTPFRNNKVRVRRTALMHRQWQERDVQEKSFGIHLGEWQHTCMQTDLADEWQEWFRLTPLERWQESMKLWAQYLAQGGSLDPEPDSQSPFDFPELRGPRPVDGRSGLRILRRGEVSPGPPRCPPSRQPPKNAGGPGAETAGVRTGQIRLFATKGARNAASGGAIRKATESSAGSTTKQNRAPESW